MSRTLRRTVTAHQLGFHSGDTLSRSLALPASPADSVAPVTELWRAAVDRRTFLTSTSFLTGLALESAVEPAGMERATAALATGLRQLGHRAIISSATSATSTAAGADTRSRGHPARYSRCPFAVRR